MQIWQSHQDKEKNTHLLAHGEHLCIFNYEGDENNSILIEKVQRETGLALHLPGPTTLHDLVSDITCGGKANRRDVLFAKFDWDA